MYHSAELTRTQQWIEAIRAVLPRSDDELIDFLANEISESGFMPKTQEHGEYDDRFMHDHFEEDDDNALDSLIHEHLVLLLGKAPEETTFISRDILDAYRQSAVLSADDLDDSKPLRPPPRPDSCELCDRPAFLTVHHLFPRSEHAYIIARPPDDVIVSKQSLLITHIAYLCRPCHSAVHRIADNRKLATELFTVDRLAEDPEVIKWVGYQAKQKATGMNHARFGLRNKR